MTHMGDPTVTVSPSATRISVTTPLAGEGISVSTLSVEISTRTSSSLTASPTFFAHRRTVPSVTVSPSWGIVTVVDMSLLTLRRPRTALPVASPPVGGGRTFRPTPA